MLHANLTRSISLVAAALAGAAFASCNKGESQPQATAQETDSAQPAAALPDPAGGATMTQQSGTTCPMAVQGADVRASDIDGGVALTFTTDSGDVGDLRAGAQHMAQMYEMHRGQQQFMWRHMGGGQGYGPGQMGRGHMGGGQGYGPGQMGRGHMGGGPMGQGPGHGVGPMPAASATVTNIDKGARIELRPNDPSQLGALRQHARWHAQRMQSGYCWTRRPGSSS